MKENMRRQAIFLALCLAILFASCQQNCYKIEGQAEGLADGDTLYVTNDLEALQPIDSIIIKNGEFTYKAATDTVVLSMIYTKTLSAAALYFTEPGTIRINLSTVPIQTRVGGTKANDAWQQLTDLTNEYGQQAQAKAGQLYSDSITKEEQQALVEEMQGLENELQQKIVELTEQNIDNELGFFIMANHPNNNAFSSEKCKELIERMPAKFRQRSAIQKLLEELSKSEATAVGKQINDFSFPTPDGNPLSVMSEVNKNRVTILDFWASWCGPCRKEVPFMKELYKNYHEKGLGIIGISLDEDHADWVKGIDELGMTWPQMSDLKGWQSEAGQMFQVNSIPFMVIVDQNGTILAKGLRGEELSDFLGELLGR